MRKIGRKLSFLFLFASGCSAPTAQYKQMLSEFKRTYQPQKKEEVFFFKDPLDRTELVAAVISVNPSLEAAHQAWRAMLARYPQAISYDDPMASYQFAPGTIGSKKTNFGQDIELSQRIPFPGKLALQGKMALGEAGSAKENYEWARIQLTAAASILFDNYYFIERSIEINRIYIELLTEFKKSAEAEYAAGQVTQQMPLQGEVELAELLYEQIALSAERDVIVAQINGLLHRSPTISLPPAPKILEQFFLSGTFEQLKEKALDYRQDLLAIDEQINEMEAALSLAKLQYYPDFALLGSYNSMWPLQEMRSMVGLGMNIPIQINKRRGAVEEAKANLSRLLRLKESLQDQVSVEVETSFKRFDEARSLVRILQERILPAAKDQLASVVANFQTGKNSFLDLMEAEKTLKSIELRFHNAVAELHRQLAMLDQAVGGSIHFLEKEIISE